MPCESRSGIATSMRRHRRQGSRTGSNRKITILTDGTPEDPTQAAVSLFWTTRADQMAALADGGAAGGGARAAGHMNGIRDLVKGIFINAGMPKDAIEYEPYLPGFYRARKRWDMAVKYKGALVAALEF